MPVDLNSVDESLRRALGEIPPIAVALGLLAGPTVALIGYRLIGAARRRQASPAVEAEAMWVCRDCRSVNEFRDSRCYRCGLARDAAGDLEVIVDLPIGPSPSFDVPAGSPFAAIAANPLQGAGHGPGVPVMIDPLGAGHSVAVGPGRPDDASPMTLGAAGDEAAPDDATSIDDLASAAERHT